MAHYDMLVIGSGSAGQRLFRPPKIGKESPEISMVAHNEEIGVARYP